MEIKKIISEIAIYSSTAFGMLTLGTTVPNIRGKIELKEEMYKRKLENYENQYDNNNRSIERQVIEYNNKINQQEENIRNQLYRSVVNISDVYLFGVITQLEEESDYKKYGVITKNDLNKLKELQLNLQSNTRLFFLFYCKNLESLEINTKDNITETFQNMPILYNVKKFSIYSNTEYYDKETIESIYKKMPYIEEFSIENRSTIEPGVIESIKQLKKLEISPDINCDIDLKQMTHLEELKINSNRPYDIAIWFNSEEYNYLKNNGVKVIFNEGIEEKYIEVAQKLDDILNNIQINENSTEDEVLRKILKYACENYQYDENVKKAHVDPTIVLEPASEVFYKDGELYAALEKDTQICGNYAAFVEAMYDRLYEPEKSYILISTNHGWNSIKIGEKRYYVDSTWFDDATYSYKDEILTPQEILERNLGEYCNWYKEDPQSEYISSSESRLESHTPLNNINYTEDNYEKSGINIEHPTESYNYVETNTTSLIPKVEIKTNKLNTDITQYDELGYKFIKMYNKNISKNISIAALSLTLSAILRLRRRKEEQKKLIKK